VAGRARAGLAARLRTLLALLIPLLAGSAAAGQPEGASGPDYRRALAVSQAAIGGAPGDHPLRTSDGRRITLHELRGRPLVVSFVYTGCFQACPVTTQFLAQSVRSARDALGADRFRVLSIGFNQPFDGPAEMADFARRNGIADRDWLFVSPNERDVPALVREFGFVHEATPKGFDHLAQATIVDAQGVVQVQVYGETFDLQMLVGPLKSLIAGEAAARLTLDDIWTKVKLYCTVYDPYSGGYRLNYSLFVELFAGFSFVVAVSIWMLRERRRSRA
jgi:protein SCO1/2